MAVTDNFHSGNLKQGQPLGATNQYVLLTADNAVIDATGLSLIYVGSDNTTASARTFTLVASGLVGHALTLTFYTAGSTTAQLVNTGATKLAADWTPTQYDVLCLVSDGTNWVETSRGPDTVNAGSIVNSDVSATAAIAFSKLAALPSAQVLVGSSLNVPTAVALTGDVTVSNAGVTAVGTGKVTQAMLVTPQTTGLGVRRVGYSVFDPSTVSGDRTIGAHALAATVPINAFVTGCWYWVETTFTSATDAGTIALSIEGANDEVTAIAISDVTNPWDTSAKPVEGITKIETTSTWLVTTAARAVTATVAVEALTAGKMHIWCEYLVHA